MNLDLEKVRKTLFDAEMVKQIQIKKIFDKNANRFLKHTIKKNQIFNSDQFIRNLQSVCGGINILEPEYETSNGGFSGRHFDKSPLKSNSLEKRSTLMERSEQVNSFKNFIK